MKGKNMRHKSYDAGEVLDRAVDAFWQRGYQSTSISDLEEATGINRYSLYNSFDSKEGLFRQAMDRYYERRVAPRVATLLDPAIPGLAAIRSSLSAVSASIDSDRPVYLLTTTLANGGALEPAVLKRANCWAVKKRRCTPR